MTTTLKSKEFDCIAFKREVQSRIYDETKNLTPEEQIQYFRRIAEEGSLCNWWRKVKAQEWATWELQAHRLSGKNQSI